MFVLFCLVSVEFCDVEVVVSLDDIGNTPLVELKRLARNGGAYVFEMRVYESLRQS